MIQINKCDLPLFMQPIERVMDFDQYDGENPAIWRAFESQTLWLIGQGFDHYGAKAIFEQIRFQRILRMGKQGHFKLNNNFTACYARKFMRHYPQFNGFFETRKSQADHDIF
jgi:hypothetical protein